MTSVRYWGTLCIAAIGLVCLAGTEVVSPDGRTMFSLESDATGLLWSMSHGGTRLVLPSRLGVKLCGQPALGPLKVVGQNTSRQPAYAECEVRLEESAVANGVKAPRRLTVIFRAYDDGVAFRYVVPKQPAFDIFELSNELTEWRFAGRPQSWTTTFGSYQTSEEEAFVRGPLSAVSEKRLVGMPVLVEAGGQTIALCEANLTNWAGQFFRRMAGSADETVLRAELAPLPPSSASTAGSAVIRATPAASPWRVVLCADNELGLIGRAGLLKELNPPPEEGLDFSWVKPGASSWDWWAEGNNSLSTELTLGLVDFAAEMGWPYHTLDGGWYGLARRPNHGPDVKVRPRPGFDLERIVRHGRSKGVGIIVWMHWSALEDNGIDETFDYLEKTGVRGVKIDFLERQDQWMVCWTEKVLRSAARHRLLVNFHGAFHPSGTERTWPNGITREAIRGNEMNLFSSRATSQHAATLPFTRFLLGPGDYTPGSFANVYAHDFVPSVSRGLRYGDESCRIGPQTTEMGTRAQALAKCIAFDSPLMTLCDWPERYRNQSGLEVLKALPTVWRRTLPIAGKCGECYAVVRESADGAFYFAAFTVARRSIELDLGFLGEGTWTMSAFTDGARTLSDAKAVDCLRESVNRNQKKTFELYDEGGAVAIFKR